ncbi:putative transposase/invertase (TIGR01784 family) [Pedobacter sp. AK017]|uniref:hypothetical protein n=1 Tax=Pedobacter sp. AK017 TaxID=2723073 RepID=UPI00161F39AF|nr:hypothetical protein [Pedobacter sp. AK017]MBB5440100.1 putative transposase/invertase (TIGR01784 family) [Pedobacter sp. AK017]
MGTEEYLLQKSKAEGVEIGEVKGEHKKAVEMAHKLIAKGMPINEISELTGLSIKEIQSL